MVNSPTGEFREGSYLAAGHVRIGFTLVPQRESGAGVSTKYFGTVAGKDGFKIVDTPFAK
ncbi:hypothetical protein GCM10009037_24560 [Halarchaeum grantii]|uniref:Uncharacterized protein n=1 Tax=Halarchaeum grantii TaxID=1193105 RepID=A0A830F590_9EURY|nr:hypothetical protein GCM10009037_24560 [Halarchaeum grantii]